MSKTYSFDDSYIVRTAPSSASSSSTVSSRASISRCSSGDGTVLDFESAKCRKAASMRKRPSPRSPNSDLDTPGSQHRKPNTSPMSSSLSFRRKKGMRRRGFIYILHNRKAATRILIPIFMIFILSFFVAFFRSRKIEVNLVGKSAFFGKRWKLQKPPLFQSTSTKTRKLPSHKLQKLGNTGKTSTHDTKPSNAVVVRPGRLRGRYDEPAPTVDQQQPHEHDTMPLPTGQLPEVRKNRDSRDPKLLNAPPPSPNVLTGVDARPGLRGVVDTKENDRSGFVFKRYTTGAPDCGTGSASSDVDPEQVDFTVVTQLSLNRLWMLEHHCSRWKHAISLSVYTGNDSTETVTTLREQIVIMGCSDDQITVQIVSGYSEEEYPINVLRNIALSAVKTSHVVYVDVDFWESIDLYDVLHQHRQLLASDPKLALVVPAFQLSRQCREWRDCRDKNVPQMPHSKDELVDLMVSHNANAFDPSNIGGHGSTRYKDWLLQEEDELIPIECVNSNRYEPYLVFRHCHDLPPFQEAFTGYGKNKMTWVMQLRRSGYQLMQLGGAFVVHYPHLDSKARMHWNGGKDGSQVQKPKDPSVDLAAFKRGQVDQTFIAFRNWLDEAIPDKTLLPMCDDALDDDERLWVTRET